MSGTITLASSGPNGAGNAASSSVALSADGTKVAFDSAASNLVAGDTNGTRDVFVKDLATGTVTLASAGSDGLGNGFSSNPSLSADGTKIAFNSTASNLVAGDTNGLRDVFVKDLSTGAVTLVSPGPDWPDYSRSSSPVLSADGTKIMFESFARNSPTSGMFDFPIFGDIFVKDLATGAVTRLTDARGSGGSSGDSFSADGTKVSFTTGGDNFTTNVFVQDLVTGVVTLANGAPDGRGSASLGSSSLSADGAKVAFSSASILVDGDTNGRNDIFVKDLATGAVTLASAGPDGEGNGSSSPPSLSADGTKVAFGSAASNLVAGDTNGSEDVFVKDLSVPINTTTIGSGPDSLVLRVSQDAYQGSAQYTVSVDGAQVGGVLTASASRGSGSDVITVRADLAPGPHEVRLTFLNDAYGGTPATDRNLFLDGATYNGAAVPGAEAALYSAGPAIFGITDNTPPPPGSAVTVGAGPDALVLTLQQDAYQGDAQYTVSVDGAQVGGVLTASATRASGLSDTLTVRGDFAVGDHTASVAFLNDAWDGTADTDRNLYVTGGTYNGATVPDAAFALYRPESASFGFTDVMG